MHASLVRGLRRSASDFDDARAERFENSASAFEAIHARQQAELVNLRAEVADFKERDADYEAMRAAYIEAGATGHLTLAFAVRAIKDLAAADAWEADPSPRPPSRLLDIELRRIAEGLLAVDEKERPGFALLLRRAADALAPDEDLERCQGQVAAYHLHSNAIGQYLVAAHKPGEVDHEAVAILDGYHVGAREVAGGGQGEPGETTLQAALRLLTLAHARGAFAAANPRLPVVDATGPTFRVALIDSVETIPDWVDADEFKDANFEDGYRACLVISSNGKVRYHWDGGEPEDNLYLRDWSWVAPALDDAYRAGRDDVLSGAVPPTWDQLCDKIRALGLRCYIRGGEGVETALMIDGPAVYYAPDGIHKAPQGPRIADVYDHAVATFLPRVVERNVVNHERLEAELMTVGISEYKRLLDLTGAQVVAVPRTP